jgi:DNA-binding transcriptional LysR family regulator
LKPLFSQEELAGGRLVIASRHPVPSELAYYLMHPERKGDLFKVCVFRDWLIEQCREDRGLAAPLPSR